MPDQPPADELTPAQRAVLDTETQYAADPAGRPAARLATAERLFGPDSPQPARSRPIIRYLQVLIDLREHPAACAQHPLVMASLRGEASRAAQLRASTSTRGGGR